MNRHMPLPHTDLGDAIFRPATIALIGASADLKKNNSRPQRYLAEAGFTGQVVPVNPARDEVLGTRAYPDLTSIPFGVDHIFVMVPAAHVEGVIDQAVAKGVKVATIFSAGFAELGPEGAVVQARIAAKARAGGLRLLGPNCIGLINTHAGMLLTTNAALQKDRPAKGGVSVISQSGSMLGSIITRASARGIGFSKLVSIGNESDLSVGDLVSLLAEDEETKTILLFLETIRDGEALAVAARKAFAAGKPVIAYKLGKSSLGRRVAASHTGAMVGGDELADAFFRANGILRVDTMEGLIELPRLVEGYRPPKSNRAGMITATGGAAAMIVDRLGVMGDEVPEPPLAFRERLAAEGIEISDSPLIDLPMGTGDGGRYARILSELHASDHCDAVVSIMGSSSRSDPQKIADRVLGATLGAKPLAVFLAPQAEEGLKIFQEAGIAAFRTPESCADAVHAYLNWRAPKAEVTADCPAALAQLTATASWDERSSGALFDTLGVPVARSLVLGPDQIAKADLSIFEGPVVVKALSPDILHKSDAGLVRLPVAQDQIAAVAAEILAKAKAAFPQARLEGVLVQSLEKGLAEVILGYQHDHEVGPVVVLGMGGVTAELRPSIAVRLAPCDLATAKEMVATLPELKALAGYRNLPEGDLDALAQAVVAFSRLASLEGRVAEAEINPVLIRGKGQGVVAVDGLLTLRIEAQ